jgi:hypothetical protein
VLFFIGLRAPRRDGKHFSLLPVAVEVLFVLELVRHVTNLLCVWIDKGLYRGGSFEIYDNFLSIKGVVYGRIINETIEHRV